jgi:hypothetical protein
MGQALIIDIYGESGEASRGTSVESRGLEYELDYRPWLL